MTDNNAYDIKSIAVDLLRVADSLERHNQLQAAILAEMRALRITQYSDDWTRRKRARPPTA